MEADRGLNIDTVERAKVRAATMHPEAAIRTRSFRGRPVVLAVEDKVIWMISLDAPSEDRSQRSQGR